MKPVTPEELQAEAGAMHAEAKGLREYAERMCGCGERPCREKRAATMRLAEVKEQIADLLGSASQEIRPRGETGWVSRYVGPWRPSDPPPDVVAEKARRRAQG